MSEEQKKRYTTFVRGKEYELTKEQHVMKRRFRQREEYHQMKRKPKETSFEEAAEEMIPLEYEFAKRDILEDKVLQKMEIERILNMLKAHSAKDCDLIMELYFKEMTETEVAKKMHITQQSVNERKRRILKWLRDNI
ncbi:MAG: hypothetical protein KHW81_15815 [[Clostridium] innocuum]|nr:hypothetical protein [[Clostridium] innocuum]MBS5685838.1 hypothetical protein [[Clostridium] innocuum]